MSLWLPCRVRAVTGAACGIQALSQSAVLLTQLSHFLGDHEESDRKEEEKRHEQQTAGPQLRPSAPKEGDANQPEDHQGADDSDKPRCKRRLMLLIVHAGCLLQFMIGRRPPLRRYLSLGRVHYSGGVFLASRCN